MLCVPPAQATELGPSDSADALFAAYEGRATHDSPRFLGIDLFRFDSSGKIAEIQVYRSNWRGAQNHAERKLAIEEALRQEKRSS